MENIKSWFTYVNDNWEFILEEIINTAQMVLIVIAAATVTSVLLGVFIQRRPVARAVVLALSGIVLTIPSLALFALFIPVVGIGNPPAMLALYLYALMPVLRNTVTGLDSVSPAVVESAKGMGMGTMQQLLRVKLPLAWPVIMAGVRISSLMTVGISAIAILVGGDGLGTYIQGGLTRFGLPNSENSVWIRRRVHRAARAGARHRCSPPSSGSPLPADSAHDHAIRRATAEHREGKPMSSEPKIHLDKVGKTYPGTKVPAVEELTLDIHEGEILVLVGPSGCGKSTTLRLINRMIEPSGGRILLDGEDVTKVNPDKLRRRIGYVIQQIGLFPHQTISQNIATVPRMARVGQGEDAGAQ